MEKLTPRPDTYQAELLGYFRELTAQYKTTTEITSTDIELHRTAIQSLLRQHIRLQEGYTSYLHDIEGATTERGYIKLLHTAQDGYLTYVREHDNLINAYSDDHVAGLTTHLTQVRTALSNYLHYIQRTHPQRLSEVEKEVSRHFRELRKTGVYVHKSVQEMAHSVLGESSTDLTEHIDQRITEEIRDGNYDIHLTDDDITGYLTALRSYLEVRISSPERVSEVYYRLMFKTEELELLQIKRESVARGLPQDYTDYITKISKGYIVGTDITSLSDVMYLQEKLNRDIHYITDGKLGVRSGVLLGELNSYPQDLVYSVNEWVRVQGTGTALYYVILNRLLEGLSVGAVISDSEITTQLDRHLEHSYLPYKQNYLHRLKSELYQSGVHLHKKGKDLEDNYLSELGNYIRAHHSRIYGAVIQEQERIQEENMLRYVEGIRGRYPIKKRDIYKYRRIKKYLEEFPREQYIGSMEDLEVTGYDDYVLMQVIIRYRNQSGETAELLLEVTPYYAIDTERGIYLYLNDTEVQDALDASQEKAGESEYGLYQYAEPVITALILEGRGELH